jgi:DNA (cytosine-5)-methyltransferase 1
MAAFSRAGLAMPTFYEFFAGGGMARAGLGKKWECLFANDIDAKKGASYVANWGDEHLRIEDVGTLVTADLPGRADLAWASFPCQDLSLAGAGAGLKGKRSRINWPPEVSKKSSRTTLMACARCCLHFGLHSSAT